MAQKSVRPSATSLVAHFTDYAESHQTAGNQACHSVGIPLIMTALLGLLGNWVGPEISANELLRVDGGTGLLALAVLWYLFLDWRIALPFALFGLGLYFLGRAMPIPVLWVLFIAGWVFQYVGHLYYEKKSPAFYSNIKHFLIGPLWVFCKWVGYQPSTSPKDGTERPGTAGCD